VFYRPRVVRLTKVRLSCGDRACARHNPTHPLAAFKEVAVLATPHDSTARQLRSRQHHHERTGSVEHADREPAENNESNQHSGAYVRGGSVPGTTGHKQRYHSQPHRHEKYG